MDSKDISIRKELYRKLKKLQKEGESISDVIGRLLNEEHPIGSVSLLMKHFGAWKELPHEFDQVVNAFRNSMNENLEERIKERL